jgi:2-polyprenyl-3-methyl-5-hydroxy-6-metoxy-1,4-benzoquinol methylase
LQPRIDSSDLHAPIDPDARIRGLRQLREENNARILDELAALSPLNDKRLLDVGSAHGWFVLEAGRRGMVAEGIEPEEAMVDYARAHGATIRHGYFPTGLDEDECLDVIAFNDVLEHIPDAEATIRACASSLRPGGLLSINVPTASGLAYRAATCLARLGMRRPYRRLWQFGFPSPHTHYFTPRALTLLLEREGFEISRISALPSIRREGLWARVHTASRPSPLSVLSFAALWLAAPLLASPRHSDIVLVIARLDRPQPARTR